jgi:cell division transport system permease protein
MITWFAQHRAALRLALRRLAAAPLNTLLSVVAIGVALALPAGGQMLLANAMQLARNASPSPQISLFLRLDADRKASSEIETRLKQHPAGLSVQFLPKEETLERMKASPGLREVIEVLPRNPFPDAFVVVPRDDRPEAMDKLAAEFRLLPRVEHVQLDSAWVRRLDVLLRLGRSGVGVLALLLGVGLIAITFNIIRLQVLTQRSEIEVSALLGATDSFIRRPFLYFGALLGLLGGSAAWLLVMVATLWLRSPLGELAQLYGLSFSLAPLNPRDSVLLFTIAGALGWLGAWLSLRQHLVEN